MMCRVAFGITLCTSPAVVAGGSSHQAAPLLKGGACDIDLEDVPFQLSQLLQLPGGVVDVPETLYAAEMFVLISVTTVS